MSFCLPKEFANKVIEALKVGKLDPAKLSEMTSVERRTYLEEFVGKENAKNVNALFESKLLLKNQQTGMINWAKQITGIKPEVKRDLITRIEKMKEILTPESEAKFLNDLASKKLGIEVTLEEAKEISKLSDKNIELKQKAIEIVNRPEYQEKMKDGSDPRKETAEEFKTRMEAGFAFDDLRLLIGSLKPESKGTTFKEFISEPSKYFERTGNFTKATVASMDNSFWGNQGLATLLDPRTSDIWGRRFLQSFGQIKDSLKGGDPLRQVRADAYSRPDALNGTYAREKLSIGIGKEEAIPTDIQQRIPVLGKLFKASNDAYGAAAISLRIDLMDRLNAAARKAGVDLTNKTNAEALGMLVNSATGRGSLGVFEPGAPKINAFVFSAKLAKGTFDTLTAHLLNPKVRTSKFAQKQAAYKIANMTMMYYGLVSVYNALTGDDKTNNTDPRSAHFGDVKIGNSYVNILGPFKPIAKTLSTILPTFHEGNLGFWRKDSKGNWQGFEVFPQKAAKYGAITPLDILEGFFEGKASPLFSTILSHWRGKDFAGNLPTPKGDISNLVTPITISNYFKDIDNKNVDSLLVNTVLNGIGFSVRTPEK